MKRTIILGIAMMLLLTSCKMNDGSEHRPIDVGRSIATWTNYNLRTIESYLHLIAMVDYYLATDAELREELMGKDIEDIVIVFDKATNTIAVGNNYETTTAYIATDGKLLSEGGTWNINNGEILLTSTEEGMTATFALRYGYYDKRRFDATLTIESLNYVKESGVEACYNGHIDIVESNDSPSANSYTLSIDIISSIKLKEHYIYDGRLDVEYRFSGNDYADNIKMDYLENRMINVSYRGDGCKIYQ